MKKLLRILTLFLVIPSLCFAGPSMFTGGGSLEDSKTAFGELSTAELTPIVQIQFPYNINAEQVRKVDNASGTVTQSAQKAVISSGAAANSSAKMESLTAVKYNPGQGGIVRYTGLFTTCIIGNTQWIGLGDSSDGYFFGCNGTSFGILRRQGGMPEIQTLTITTGSSDAENITITLDGDALATVAVTASGSTTTTAEEIAAADYDNEGSGWMAYNVNSTVIFISEDAESKAGTFTLTDAISAVGTFAETVDGVTPTETITAQTSWNFDVMDGTGFSGFTLDSTKMNIYSIKYQWLGGGPIDFLIENSEGKQVLVHREKYPNTAIIPSIDNPELPLHVFSGNTSNTSNVVVSTSSMMGGVEGRNLEMGPLHSDDATASITTANVVLSLRNKAVYQGRLNRTRIKLMRINFATDGAKTVNFAIFINIPTIGGTPAFSDHDTNRSVAQLDSAGTTVSGGEKILDVPMEKVGSNQFDVNDLNVFLNPGDVLTVVATSSVSANDVEVGITWKELF